ncbi:MAG: caspase family protein [Lewinella sp.]|nr:caspase family protein [Lewinella sp.]
MKKIQITGLLFIILCFGASAQRAPGLIWKKHFGGNKADRALDVAADYTGRIAVAASTTSPAEGDKAGAFGGQDALFMLLDADGQVRKETRLGGKGNDLLKSVAPTFDGGFILAGRTTSSGAGKTDGWLVKLDENGDTLWQKTVGFHRNEEFNDIIQTADGGLLAVGSIERAEGKTDMWVYCAYPDGTVRWQQTFGNRGADEARAVAETQDGHIAIAGVTSQGKGGRNIWLFIIDKNGKPLNHHIFGSRMYEEVNGIVATMDGGFALSGFAKTNTENEGRGMKDAWLIKTAADGEMVWQTTVGGRSNDSAFGMTETTDGSLLLVGYTFSHLIGANTSNALIAKVDSAGKLIWQTDEYGGKADDELTAAALLPDGSFVLAGTTASRQEEAREEDIWVMRLNREYDFNTTVPTQLAISGLQLLDNGDGILEEGEEAWLSMTVENKGRQDAYDADLVIQETGQNKFLQFAGYRKIGFLAPGRSRRVLIPVKALEGVAPGDAAFEVFCTDASRTRTQPATLSFTLKPLNLPSDYLDIQWMWPAAGSKPGRELQVEVKQPVVSIRVRTRSDRKLNKSHFTILLNGQPYKVGQKAGEANLADKGKTRDIFTYEYVNQVELTLGMNTIEVVAENGSKKAVTPAIRVEYSNKPNLHVLAVGIDHDDLKYTARDAMDFAASFAGQDGKLFDKVYMTALVSGSKTRSGVFQTDGDVVRKAFRDLQDKYQYTIYEQDLLLVFVSSHGKTVNNEFKIIPTDFGLTGEKSLIDYRQDIIDQLTPLPCRKLVFIDACHSGSFDLDEASGTAVGTEGQDNAQSKALIGLSDGSAYAGTLASCRSDESSWEDARWNNGAFTEAILGAFHNEPFRDGQGVFSPTDDDRTLTIGELYRYISRRVPQMLLDAGKQGAQHPYLSQEQYARVKDIPVFEVGGNN